VSSADFDRRLNDWFDAVEPRTVPLDLLAPVLRHVAQTRQDRGPWQRFVATIELARRPMTQVSWGLGLLIVTALLIVALAAVGLAAGIIRLPAKTTIVDGLIAVQDEIGSEEPGSYRIRFIDPRTGTDVFTTPSSVRACGAQFSPDGSQYAFLYQDAGSDAGNDISVAVAPAVADFQPTLLMRKPVQMYFDPAWAPDARSLASTMEVADLAFRELWVLPADGRGGRRLTEVQTSFSADWSTDGEWIAFVGVGLTHPLYIIRPDGSDLRLLVPSGVDSVAWSPVRRELAFSASDARLHVISLNGTELLAMDDGRDPITTDLTGAGVIAPVWSDDGTKVAMVVDGALKIFDIAAGSVASIVLPDPISRSVWSASGRTLVVVTTPAEQVSGDLLEVSLNGTAPRLIAHGVRANCMSASAALSWQRLTQP